MSSFKSSIDKMTFTLPLLASYYLGSSQIRTGVRADAGRWNSDSRNEAGRGNDTRASRG